MSLKRRSAVAGLIVAITLVSLLTILPSAIQQRTAIDRQHFDQIRQGMSQVDVEKLLEGPPRNELSHPAIVWLPKSGQLVSARISKTDSGVPVFEGVPESRQLMWVSETALIAIRLDESDRVDDTHFSDVNSNGPDAIDWVVSRFR